MSKGPPSGGPFACKRTARRGEHGLVSRLFLLGVVVVAVLVFGASGVVGALPDLRDRAEQALRDRSSGAQGGAQISGTEFVRAERGITPQQLRELVGDPESSSKTRIEGLELECLYYGIVGASGAYQFCFAEGKLVSRYRFGP